MATPVLPTQSCNTATKEREIDKEDWAYSSMDMDFHLSSHDIHSDDSNYEHRDQIQYRNYYIQGQYLGFDWVKCGKSNLLHV